MAMYAKKLEEPYVTPEEYLQREREAETRSEYYDGRIVAMSGASWEHNLINSNIAGTLHALMKGKPCYVTSNDLKVRAKKRNSYVYPDTAVICGKPQFESSSDGIALNPIVVVEVLSPSTQARDRREKRDIYQSLESLQAYLLVSQDSPRVALHTRQPDGSWRDVVVVGLESAVAIEPLECSLRMEDVYRNVEFEDEEAESASQNP